MMTAAVSLTAVARKIQTKAIECEILHTGDHLIPWDGKITNDSLGAAETSRSIERRPGRSYENGSSSCTTFRGSERMREKKTDHGRVISHSGVRNDRPLREAGHLTSKREAR